MGDPGWLCPHCSKDLRGLSSCDCAESAEEVTCDECEKAIDSQADAHSGHGDSCPVSDECVCDCWFHAGCCPTCTIQVRFPRELAEKLVRAWYLMKQPETTAVRVAVREALGNCE